MNTHSFTTGARRGLAVVALTGLSLGAAAGAASADTWDQLAQCESGGNWNINTGNGYYGGLQFTPSSWAAAGGNGSPANASVAEQKRVAANLQEIQGWGAWPACSAKLGLTSASSTAASGSTGVSVQQAPVAAAPVAPAPVAAAPVAQAPVAAAPIAPAPVAAAPVAPAPVAAAPIAPAPVAAAPIAPAPVAHAPVALSGETYVIQAGDTLSTIAAKLGIEGGWQALFAANTDTVIHQDLIFTGAVLQLPA